MATKTTDSTQLKNRPTQDGTINVTAGVILTEGVIKKGGLGAAPTTPKPTASPGQKPVQQQGATPVAQQSGSGGSDQSKKE